MNTNQTISNSKNNNNNMQASDAIEARMQTVQASLRQERDKARRDYELAMERLGLLRAEVEATDIAVQDRQKQLTTIVEETQRLEAKLPSLRETVQRLTKEVRVIHTDAGRKAFPFRRVTALRTRLDSHTANVALLHYLFHSSTFNMPR